MVSRGMATCNGKLAVFLRIADKVVNGCDK
jgi:hypothetical protein